MEAYIKSLYDRLNPDQQKDLFLLTQKSIDEMSNHGIIAGVTDPELMQKLHDPNPEVRVSEKTLLAKEIGRKYIVNTDIHTADKQLNYDIEMSFNAGLKHSITLALQDILEKLYLTDIWKEKHVVFHIHIQKPIDMHDDTDQLVEKLSLYYEDFTFI